MKGFGFLTTLSFLMLSTIFIVFQRSNQNEGLDSVKKVTFKLADSDFCDQIFATQYPSSRDNLTFRLPTSVTEAITFYNCYTPLGDNNVKGVTFIIDGKEISAISTKNSSVTPLACYEIEHCNIEQTEITAMSLNNTRDKNYSPYKIGEKFFPGDISIEGKELIVTVDPKKFW